MTRPVTDVGAPDDRAFESAQLLSSGSWVAGDSLRVLAQDIIEKAFPGAEIEAAIRAEVDAAVRKESERMERAIADVRMSVLSVALVYSAAAALGFSAGPSRPGAFLGLVAAWWVGALALWRALHRGGYRRWMRQVVPAADAVLLAGAFAVSTWGVAVLPAPVVAAGGALSVLLAFLGPTRLSRSASRISALGGTAVWLYVGGQGQVPWSIWGGVAVLVLSGSYLGGRLRRGIRELIGEQAKRTQADRMYQEAQAKVAAREEVLGVVCHDLRTPLTTIAATAGLLLEIPLGQEAQAQHLRVVQRVTDHMNRLIHDLLDVCQLDTGKLRVDLVPCSLERILAGTAELMRGPAADKQIELVIEPLPATVLADEERVRQVLSNLIGNAVKFSPPGTQITLAARPAGAKVRLSVRDQGPGIAPEEIAQLFKPLWQADPRDRRGLGLGLHIAKSLVEAHGEQMDVDSRLGEGTEFWFTLALAASSPVGRELSA